MTTRRKTGGRTKGTPNKVHAAVKEAIIAAFDKLGGEAYLVEVAKSDARTFCTLLGKVLPMQLTGAGDDPIRVANEGGEVRDILFAKIERMRASMIATGDLTDPTSSTPAAPHRSRIQ